MGRRESCCCDCDWFREAWVGPFTLHATGSPLASSVVSVRYRKAAIGLAQIETGNSCFGKVLRASSDALDARRHFCKMLAAGLLTRKSLIKSFLASNRQC